VRVAPRQRSVGFFAPSSYLPDPAIMDRVAQFFAARGWRVSAGESVFAREQRFAGPDALRLGELQQFATDPGIDVAIAARGGYGISRLLGEIDYAGIAAAGRPLVGYSDFTAVNLALLARAGAVSFQGPSASDFAGPPGSADHPAPDPDSDAAFTIGHFFGALTSERYAIDFTVGEGGAVPADLSARGRLWGGNLAMVCSLLGTPYFPRVTGGLLFLEDTNEPWYRIGRLLLQLLHAGVLDRQKAILLGDFSPVPVVSNDQGFGLTAICTALAARCATPVITGLPFGHGRRRATLPVGAAARITVEGAQARLEFQGHPTVRPQ
jgi:muramoyltetrapeptide carboxypeptidase